MSPEDLVRLYASNDESEIVLLVNALEARGISAINDSSNYVKMVPWEVLALHEPYRVLVRLEDFDRAREIAGATLNVSPDAIDWEEVDVGEPEDELAARLAAEQADMTTAPPSAQPLVSARFDHRAEHRAMRTRAVRGLILVPLAGWFVLQALGIAFAAIGMTLERSSAFEVSYTLAFWTICAVIAVLSLRYAWAFGRSFFTAASTERVTLAD